MGDFGSDIKWIFFVPITLVIMMSIFNGYPSNILGIFNITQNTTQVVPADCQSYKSQIEQQQAKIEQLDKDISDCKNQSPSGFTLFDFFMGFILGAGIVLFWSYEDEKKRKAKEEWEKLNKSLSKAKGRRRK